jgi:hypothetical protein
MAENERGILFTVFLLDGMVGIRSHDGAAGIQVVSGSWDDNVGRSLDLEAVHKMVFAILLRKQDRRLGSIG